MNSNIAQRFARPTAQTLVRQLTRPFARHRLRPQCRPQGRPVLFAMLFALALLSLWPATLCSAKVSHDPRPISDAERAAVEAVIGFLDSGPNAVLTRLAADSPMRAISTSHAIDEIAVRMGPAEGSAWTLRTPGRNFEQNAEVAIFTVEFASGVDDIILMHMVEEAGGWVIQQIRCTADPRMPANSVEEELNRLFQATADDSFAPIGPGGFPTRPEIQPILLMAALWTAALLLLTGRFVSPGAAGRLLAGHRHVGRFRAGRRGLVALVLASALVAGGCQFLPSGDDEADEVPFVELEASQLTPLLPLRRALTGGRTSGKSRQVEMQEQVGEMVRNLVGGLDPAEPVAVAARAWQAQMLMLDGSVGAASKILDAAPQPDTLPLMAILRARLAIELEGSEVIKLYDNVRRLGPDHDGLALEAAWGAYSVGALGKMEENMRSQVWMRSRDATGYYYTAMFDAILDQESKAEDLFEAGWRREPLSRMELLGDPMLARIAIRPAVFPLLRFIDAEEPKVGPSRSARRPLEVPERTTSHILGEHLTIGLDDRSLSIYGGGDIMPEGTVIDSAEERANRESEVLLDRFDELMASLADGGVLRPSQRREAESLTDTLAAREEWQKLIDLTEPLAESLGTAPPSLMQNRALALIRSKQTVAATNLLIELGQNDQTNRRRDPITFYHLGEMLRELGRYDLALRSMERASNLGSSDFTAQRRMQIELMKELDESKKVYDSRHFRMIYPASTGERYPRQLSWVLEAEWDRVQKWIPVSGTPKVEIHLFPWMRFMEAYAQSGGLVGGLYDGVVRVPFADFKTFHSEALRVVSHETAHAMIDIATRGNAPKWFHEGLAGHIEMHQRELNPMPDMHAAGRDLSFRLLDPILSGWSEPQLVELAYNNAAWALHYIEAKKGKAGIHRMLDAFRRGHDTDGAIRKVFGVSVAQFDRDFRHWAIHDAPQIWPSESVSYQEKFDHLVQRDAMDPLPDQGDDSNALQSGNIRFRQGQLERDIRAWHADYEKAVRPVKVALAKAMPLLQGQAEGDVQGACRKLREELDVLLRDRNHLNSPDAEVATSLRQAYSSFQDMTQHCRSRKWKNMRTEMERAVQYLGKAKDGMHVYGVKP